jgi:NAD+ kinase
MKYNTIGLIVKTETSVTDIVVRLCDFLASRQCEVLLDISATDIVSCSHVPVVSRDELGDRIDLAIMIGGDGSFLNAARSLADKGIPLIGINVGRLGFMVDISPDDLETCLEQILQGNAVSDERFLLEAQVKRGNEIIFSGDALNDVVLHIRDVARMIEFETRINGHYVYHQRADGLVICTPTGSTAYALSSGGPLLDADLEAIALVPICPHTLTNRPIVVDSDSEIEVIVCESKNAVAQVTCDGQTAFELDAGDHIMVRRKQNTITLLHPPGHDHYEILRAKLHWSEHP